MESKQFLSAECSACKKSIRYCAQDIARREYRICPKCGTKISLGHVA